MSEAIKGSKSFLYNIQQMGNIPNSGDNFQHLSIQEIPGKRGAADVMIHGITVVSTGHLIEAGSAARVIVSAAHGAKQGWFMRPVDGNSVGEEVAIINVVDANTFVIAALIDLAIGNEFEIIKSVSPRYSADGDLNVVVSGSGPVQFILDGTPTDVEEDTVNPAANIELPVKIITNIGDTLFFNYASTNVDNTAWVELVADSGAKTKSFTLFESGGYAMEIGIGAAASETRLFVVPPGGFNGEIPIPIPANSRVSIKCLEVQTVNIGLIVANFLK